MSFSFPCPVPVLAALLLAASLIAPVQAQSSCASDGQKKPLALLERFINADCADCWRDAATPRPRPGELALDWVLPGSRGEDAPLSAVATRDGLARLQALGLALPPSASSHHQAVAAGAGRLRVAHGLPVSGYVGASIRLQAPPRATGEARWTAWLALVESLPAGTEASPVPRNLVRNLLQVNWDGREQLSKKEHLNFIESRVLDIPAGMATERLRVIGWVQDAQGRLVAAAQSRCTSPR